MIRIIFFTLSILLFSNQSFAIMYYRNCSGDWTSSIDAACEQCRPWWPNAFSGATQFYTDESVFICFLTNDAGYVGGSIYFSHLQCDGQYVNGVCTPCPSGQVINPYTGQCQLPCESDQEPGFPDGFTVGISSDTVCNNGCTEQYKLLAGDDGAGFTIFQYQHWTTGEMCKEGTLSSPPSTPPPSCNDPYTVRVDGTCGPPDPICADYETLVDHQCVLEDCTPPKVRKCGSFNNAQVCTCVGQSECGPGTVKDLYGNCIIPTPCPNGLSRDPVTNLCSPDNTYDEDGCPPDTHLSGNICVADDNSECVYPEFYVSDCGCVTGANVFEKCNKSKTPGDVDGDGIPNSTDNDVDGDGIPNSVDDDDDGDGIPDNYDVTPGGLGTNHAIPTDNGDRDNDGIPDSEDSDRDGDGIDNESDPSPDGDNAVMGDPNKTQPGYDEIDPTGDLDQDGVPNNVDDDRDGDGVKNNEDATPDGGPDNDGDGVPDGVKTGQCNPDIEDCGDPNNPGKPVKIGDALYTAKDKKFSEVWNTFILTVKNAPLVSSGSRFLSIGSISSNCPTWTIPATDYNPAVPITIQCSPEVSAGLRIAGYILLVVFAWVAFKIAILD